MRIIGGKFKNKLISIPNTDLVRPTTSKVREALFNICQFSIEGCHFLDIFAGSGAMGLEALSRGAEHVTFIERNNLARQAISQNLKEFGVHQQCTVIAYDAFKALEKLKLQGSQFDIIFADPPYSEGIGKKLLHFIDSSSLLKEQGMLFIEESSLSSTHLNCLRLCSERRFGSTWLYQFGIAEKG